MLSQRVMKLKLALLLSLLTFAACAKRPPPAELGEVEQDFRALKAAFNAEADSSTGAFKREVADELKAH